MDNNAIPRTSRKRCRSSHRSYSPTAPPASSTRAGSTQFNGAPPCHGGRDRAATGAVGPQVRRAGGAFVHSAPLTASGRGWCRRRSCSSPRSSPDLDPRRNHPGVPARLEHHPRHPFAAELGEPRARRAVGQPRRHLPRRLCRRPRADARPGNSGLPDQARRSAQVSVGVDASRPRRDGSRPGGWLGAGRAGAGGTGRITRSPWTIVSASPWWAISSGSPSTST